MKILLVFLQPARNEHQQRKIKTYISSIENVSTFIITIYKAFKLRPLAPKPDIIVRDRYSVEDHLIDMDSAE